MDLTLLIDNYDSFTWNVYQYLCQLGAQVQVHRNDAITLQQAIQLNPKRIVISPGPGHPKDAGVSNEVIRYFAGKVPILGVCLGEQAMFMLYGGTVSSAGELIHGKTTPVQHDGKGLFEGVVQGVECTRYHSLAGDPSTLPDCLEITSKTDSGIVMGIRHKTFVMEGVQFHPESVVSQGGRRMFANFLSWEGGSWSSLKRNTGKIFERLDALMLQDSRRPGALGGSTPINSSKGNQSSASSILAQITNRRILDVSNAKQMPGQSLFHLKRSIATGVAPSVISFPEKILKASSQAKSVAVLAEIKRASPSKGSIDAHAHAPSQALIYASGGAAAISVLTEPTWFKGSLQDMLSVRLALETRQDRPAILRKDFILDPYQIYESRVYGADTILLIVAILTDSQLTEFLSLSRSLGMEPLVEVATPSEMKRAIHVGAKVIGINNRDLNTFEVDTSKTNSLSMLIKPNSGIILLALSGIQNRDDVLKYSGISLDGVLVGEALMRSKDPKFLIQNLMGHATKDTLTTHEKSTKRILKMCGMTRQEDVEKAIASGADLIGFIFAKESPRYVSPEKVRDIIKSVRSSHVQPDYLAYPSQSQSPEDWFTSRMVLIKRPTFVGVFTELNIPLIHQIIKDTGIDMVQFHGPTIAPHLASLIPAPVIQALSITNLIEDIGQLAQEQVSYLLLDSVSDKGQVIGGSGKTVDWELVANELQDLNVPVILAGGLNPENVAEAIRIVHPAGIDVSSGIEQSKGIKDHAKIETFARVVMESN